MMDGLAWAPTAEARPKRRWPQIGDLPKPIMCVPLVAHWFWLAARYRSLTLPSTLDPCIETGGLAGESKAACLAQIGAEHARFVAPWALVAAGADPVAVRRAAGLDYPLVAKPDIGWCGFGVRRVADDAGLAAYAAGFPQGAAFLVQRLALGPGEAGLFYVRAPGADRGHVTAITLRAAPSVSADGIGSVEELLRRAGVAPADRGLSEGERARVPPKGEQIQLATVASIRVGSRYTNATSMLTPALEAQVDAIARSMPHFHVGRFDVRFGRLADLQAGELTIIEVNGAGSEAIQFWDTSLSMWNAYAGVFAKQAMLFRHGAAMRARAYRPVGAWGLARAWVRQQRLIARYPTSN